MPELKRLRLEAGKFYDYQQDGKVLNVEVLEQSLGSSPEKCGPFFKDHDVPFGADAFVLGPVYDCNLGQALPHYVVTITFLKIKPRRRVGD